MCVCVCQSQGSEEDLHKSELSQYTHFFSASLFFVVVIVVVSSKGVVSMTLCLWVDLLLWMVFWRDPMIKINFVFFVFSGEVKLHLDSFCTINFPISWDWTKLDLCESSTSIIASATTSIGNPSPLLSCGWTATALVMKTPPW